MTAPRENHHSPQPVPGSGPDAMTAQPVRSALVAKVLAVLILIVFTVTAFVMRKANAGAHLVASDQLATFIIGVVLAGVALLPTRPRLVADAAGVRCRAFLGAEKIIGWDMIVRVEFPKKLQFARLVLPGEETIALYAVQRLDYEQALRTMSALRELHSQYLASHPA